MDCSKCGEQLPDGALFCHRCGTAQAASACRQCQAELLPGSAFCSTCGTPVADRSDARPAPAAERRMTSVLFADLVSYTSLSEQRDNEDVRELLSAYFDTCSTVIKRYGGSVEKFIGDAVMAVWGVPVAREDDAERAVRAGLELIGQVAALGEQLGIESLALRVGVVTGEVATTIGAQDQGMVAGDPVNTAARIQSAAGPGELLVDGTTRSLTAAAVTYTDAGEHQLKGKAEPVRLHRAGSVVAAVGGLQRVDGLEAPLVGRDRELRLLKELFHATEESGHPHLVVLDGEGGIGKSRLAWELEKYADGLSRTIRWHRGRCLSYGDGVAFWALAEAVRGRLGVLGDEPGPVVLSGLDRLLDTQVPDEAERSWMRPRVASLLGEESRDFPREDLFAAWTRFFERVAGEDPLVLVVDDAQHVDDGLADFLDFLVTRGTFGCFVVLLARPELLATRPHLGGRRATPVRLEPLGESAMGQLVDGLVDGLPADVRQGLVERADGIPLYAVETVRALIDRDLVVPLGGRYVVARDRDLDLSSLGAPASLHALVAARLDALTPVERRVLSDACVLGESFTREGVGILADDVAGLDDVLDALVHKQLLAIEVDRFSAERGQYRFVQTVVRQVAYGTLSRRDRKARHLAVADHLEGETERAEELAQVVAQHLLDAAEASGVDDADVAGLRARAGDLLVRAAERAAGLGAYADAARCYDAALTCLAEDLVRARVLRLQAEVLQKLGRVDDSVPLAEEAVALFDAQGDVLAAAEAARMLARCLASVDRAEESVELARARLDGLTGLEGADPARFGLLTALAINLFFLGRPAEADTPLREALRLADKVDDPLSFSMCCNILAMQQSRFGSSRVAMMIFNGMADQARQAEDWIGLSAALGNAGVQTVLLDLHEAIRLTDLSVEAATGHGIVMDETAYANLLNYTWQTGDWDRTVTILAEAAASPVPLRLATRSMAAVAALLRWAGAEVPVAAPLPEDEYAGVYQGIHEFAAGCVALEKGDPAAAAEQLRVAVSKELELSGLHDDLHVYWPLAVRAALASGEVPDGVWSVHRRILEEAPSTILGGHARVFRALLAQRRADSDPAAIEADLREGIVILDRCGGVVWRAHAQEDLGRWLVGQGRGDEGAELLEAAAATYDGLGASAWRDRVRVARPAPGVRADVLQ